MPIDPEALDALARAYTAPMTSIRGRRVHRLLLRAFARFDHVLAGASEAGAPLLLALAGDGGVALCLTDGRGPSAAVTTWSRLEGAAVTTSHDLLKDSLPVLGWTIQHPSLTPIAGKVTIPAAGLSRPDIERIAGLLQTRGAP